MALFPTKLDGDTRGGGAALPSGTGYKPIKFIGNRGNGKFHPETSDRILVDGRYRFTS